MEGTGAGMDPWCAKHNFDLLCFAKDFLLTIVLQYSHLIRPLCSLISEGIVGNGLVKTELEILGWGWVISTLSSYWSSITSEFSTGFSRSTWTASSLTSEISTGLSIVN